jgi:hypothetical protein
LRADNQTKTKHVESIVIACLDEGSNPSGENGRVKLLPRAQAESAGFALMFNNSRPSHYESTWVAKPEVHAEVRVTS